MNRINSIQNAIIEMEGGAFQKLLDAYLFKKYNLPNLNTLGVQTATNKPTKGTPDSFVKNNDGTFTLIMYGSVKAIPFNKIKSDILSCFEKDKLELDKDKIKKIICVYTSTNIHIEQIEELNNLIAGVKIEPLGLSTVSHDLLFHYPSIASDFLNISMDTGQIHLPTDFVKKYDENGMNAPLDIKFLQRKKEIDNLMVAIASSSITLVSGKSGIGKTKLVIETCKKYEKAGWQVFCLKNNGMPIYDDIRYYFSEANKYILFIDDANQTSNLEYILEYAMNPVKNVDIKIVLTVRDYAKNRLINILSKYSQPNEIVIGPLANEEIKEILTDSLGIKNSDYLDKIIRIAKGNSRLAILAGKTSLEKGFLAINNAKDIFKNYYGDIIENQQITRNQVNVLFVISILGKVRIKDSKIALKLLNAFNISHDTFLEICHDLNEKELIDLYQDEIADVSDQSLGNYILEYVLLDKKSISTKNLLEIGFPEFKNKIVFALNTLISLFYSQESANYLEQQINERWDEAPSDQQRYYLESFYQINEEKTLALVKESIDQMDNVSSDLTKFDFFKKQNNKNTNTLEIHILSGFKHLKYYQESLELLLTLLKKRTDLVMEIYTAFTDRLSYDINSHKSNYSKEIELVKTVWQYTDYGKEENATILLLYILKAMLRSDVNKTEAGEDGRSIQMIRFVLVANEGCLELRTIIWEILGILYENNVYKKHIEEILSNLHTTSVEKEKNKDIFSFDMENIKKNFSKYWCIPTFEQSQVLYKLQKNAEGYSIDYDDFFEKYETSQDFMIYASLIQEIIRGISYSEMELIKTEKIRGLIKDYSDKEFHHMFNLLKVLESQEDNENRNLCSGINLIFAILENDKTKYIETVKIYLKCGAPFGGYYHKILSKMIEYTNTQETEKIILNSEFNYKNNWLSAFFEIIPEEDIDTRYAEKLIMCVDIEVKKSNPVFPRAIYLEKYKSVDKNIILKLSQSILEVVEHKPVLSLYFLGEVFDSTSVELLLQIFEDNLDVLEKLYLKTVGHFFDYDCILLEKIIKNNSDFWECYVMEIFEKSDLRRFESEIFEWVWQSEKFSEMIEIAYTHLLYEEYGSVNEYAILEVFPNNSNSVTIQRQKEWLLEYIRKNYLEKKLMKKIFAVINTAFTEDKIEYLLEFLKHSSDYQMFKSIPLSPSTCFFSGSEVTLIDNQIEFLSKLLEEIKGIDFIEHRNYLKENIIKASNQRRAVVLNEYLTDEDIS